MTTIVATTLFSVLLISVGIYANKFNTKTEDGYFLGGRSIGTFATTMTLVFSIWSTLAFYGVIGESYNNGVGSLGIAQGIFWGSCLQVFIAYRLWTMGKMYGLSTPGDFFGERFYSPFFKIVTSVGLIFFTMPYIGIQVAGLGIGLEGATGIPMRVGTIVFASVLLLYVSIGGMRSVAWTDAVQGVVFTVVVLVALIVLIFSMPESLDSVMRQAMEARPGLTGYPGPNNVYSPMLMLHLTITIGSFVVWPHIFIRYFIAKKKETYRTIAVAFPIYEVVCMVPLLIIGITIIPYLFGGSLTRPEAEMSIQRAMLTLPYGTLLGSGIFLAAFSAAMSTASSQLLACSSMFMQDIFKRFVKTDMPEQKIVYYGRIAIAVFVVVSTTFGLLVPGIFNVVTRFATPGYAQLLPPLIAGLFWKRATREGAIAGTLVGFTVLLLTSLVWPNPLRITALLWSISANIIVLVIVTLITPKPPQEVIEKYHDAITNEMFKRSEEVQAEMNVS
ncbi:MAG: sodium:solute symporter family protein [Bacillota bacterium]|nr:sodium:solute symporter family protein [Bacillota bacterium]